MPLLYVAGAVISQRLASRETQNPELPGKEFSRSNILSLCRLTSASKQLNKRQMSKRIIMGSDHGKQVVLLSHKLGGYGLRRELASYLKEKHGYQVEELGSNGEAVGHYLSE